MKKRLAFFALAALAALMFKMGLSEPIVDGCIAAVYIFSCFLGGFFMGRIQKNRKFLWGMVIGCLYYGILFATALLLKQSDTAVSGKAFSSAVLCIASGMLGGMLS